MKRFTLSSFLILFLTVTAWSHNDDPANLKRYAEKNKQMATPPEVVFMGNSITDFWPAQDPGFFSHNNFAGRGIGGQTSNQMLTRFQQDVIALKPKAVVILAGINDIAENNGPISLNGILANIASMSELAKQNNIKVILCSVLPCDSLLWRPQINPTAKVRKLNAMIKNYATENSIYYADYYSALATPAGGLPHEIAPDHCHPNKQGYKIMESIILDGIANILQKTKDKYYYSEKE